LDSKTFITPAELRARIADIDLAGVKVYPVPKGGMCLAAYLRHAEVVDDPEQADVILDDIIDSGATRERYAHLAAHFHAAVDKQGKDSEAGWVVFPWEARDEDTGPTDAVVRLLQCVGEDPGRAGLLDTPKRYVKAFKDLTKGYGEDPEFILARVFDMEGGDEDVPLYSGMVLLRDIEVYSLCEHHLLPFVGRAHIAYIPNGNKVVGISKLARVLDVYARRLQCQEKLTAQVADAIVKYLDPKGVAVIIEAEHFCIRMRGVGKQNSVMVTSDMRGFFFELESTRHELLSLLQREK
jgi:GTP cyclohydrolase I